jgi:hypothetical protein
LSQPHSAPLRAVPETDDFFFCVRNPTDRFVSGFLSRQKQGLPNYDIPWNENEAKAFARFDSPDALAVSLSAGGADQRAAETAMRTIQHVRSSYWDWFDNPDYFKRRSDHIIWVGRQESLDVAPLAARLGLQSLKLPSDPKQANRNTQPKPALSELARENLRQWYEKDYLFIELCNELCPTEVVLSDLGSNGHDQNLVHRIMTERPFALANADAFRLARMARRHRTRRSVFHTAVPRLH